MFTYTLNKNEAFSAFLVCMMRTEDLAKLSLPGHNESMKGRRKSLLNKLVITGNKSPRETIQL